MLLVALKPCCSVVGRGQKPLLAGVAKGVLLAWPVDLSLATIPFRAFKSCLVAAAALTSEKAAALHSPRLTSGLGVLLLLKPHVQTALFVF